MFASSGDLRQKEGQGQVESALFIQVEVYRILK